MTEPMTDPITDLNCYARAVLHSYNVFFGVHIYYLTSSYQHRKGKYGQGDTRGSSLRKLALWSAR